MLAAGRWLLGVCLSLLNCALSSTGFVMQRKAAVLSEQDGSPERNFRLLWAVGVVLYVLAAVPDVIAYTLVPQVVCSTIACFRLVVVTIMAHAFLHERVQAREALGMLACTLGTLLCVGFGPKPDEPPLVSGAFYHAELVVYLSVGLAVLIVLLLLEHSDDLGWPVRSERLQKARIFSLPLATGLAFGLEKVFNTEIGFIRPPAGLPLGFIKEPQWAGMVVAIGLLGLMDFYLNLRGAQRMPVQVFVPASFALATTLLYFQSVVIFGEFRDMDPLHATFSILGACVSLLGALCIQPPRLGLLGRELVDGKDEVGGSKEVELAKGEYGDGTDDSNVIVE
mmetsp:Transcript_117941/g.367463  ORF Transcript_117941/g.367463 Transcript_117941/m.367463 type:complete len:338 (-) Transcript_117941:77-1090(-)